MFKQAIYHIWTNENKLHALKHAKYVQHNRTQTQHVYLEVIHKPTFLWSQFFYLLLSKFENHHEYIICSAWISNSKDDKIFIVGWSKRWTKQKLLSGCLMLYQGLGLTWLMVQKHSSLYSLPTVVLCLSVDPMPKIFESDIYVFKLSFAPCIRPQMR